MSGRSKAFFVNGGAGRVICSIPALERYAEDSGDKDFIIVCESGMDFYRGHPVYINMPLNLGRKVILKIIKKIKILLVLNHIGLTNTLIKNVV